MKGRYEEYLRLGLNFIDSLCLEKKFSTEIKEFLIDWTFSLVIFYEPKKNILDGFSLGEYLKDCFERLNKMKKLKIYSPEEIGKNEDSLIYKEIKIFPKEFERKDFSYFYRKEGQQFILDEKGEYYLTASGVQCNAIINLVKKEGMYATFKHELEHVHQGFYYPTYFPFSKEIVLMLCEGAAEYQDYLFSGLLPSVFFDDNFIKKYSYVVYYQLYLLLMFVIPKEVRKKWQSDEKFGKIYELQENYFLRNLKFFYDTDDKREYFSKVFAICTLIVSKCDRENTDEVIIDSIETSYEYCNRKMSKQGKFIEESLELERTQEQENRVNLQKYLTLKQNESLMYEEYIKLKEREKACLLNEPLEEQAKLLEEMEKEMTFEAYKSYVQEEIEICKRHIEASKQERTPEQILGEKEFRIYQYYQFGVSLNKNMKHLFHQKFSVEELLEMLIDEIQEALKKDENSNVDAKLDYLEVLISKKQKNEKSL